MCLDDSRVWFTCLASWSPALRPGGDKRAEKVKVMNFTNNLKYSDVGNASVTHAERLSEGCSGAESISSNRPVKRFTLMESGWFISCLRNDC